MKRGFTLIELLVVIAIIGLLATIIIAPIKCAMNKEKCQAQQEKQEELSEKAICERKSLQLTLAEMPVGCLKYFK